MITMQSFHNGVGWVGNNHCCACYGRCYKLAEDELKLYFAYRLANTDVCWEEGLPHSYHYKNMCNLHLLIEEHDNAKVNPVL